jgi:uncharacterized protein YjbI with pentapeptide repeats
MKLTTILTTLCLLTSFTATARAENLSHTRQLLATKSCQQCNLSGVGLVMNDLDGANLSQANLVGANLSRTNLMGADLRGANLSGASLFGANLTGADLRGANLNGTDLREAYLTNANVKGIDVSTAYLQGAVGMASSLGTAEDFYKWGFLEWQKNDFASAIGHYNQAIALKVDFPGAYLGRAMAKFRLQDDRGAMKDAAIAEKLFLNQSNQTGAKTAQALTQKIQLASQPTQSGSAGNGNFVDLLTGLSSMLLKFF